MRSGPLSGIKVLDLTTFVSGPFACSLLADLGADVIKVESPEGDTQRHYPSTLAGESRVFLGINRGKRAIIINLKDAQGKAILQRLLAKTDVLVENFRPSVPARLGISYETLKEEWPRLIYCAIRGYGDTGPMRDRPGYDQVVQTLSGMAAFQGAATGDTAQLIRGALIDFYTASMAAMGVIAALFERASTGKGQYVMTSLLAAALTMQAGRLVWAENEPRDVNRELLPGRIAGIHPTKEGGLYLSAHTERFWQNLCNCVGLPQLADNPRYNSSRKRSDFADELLPKLHAALQRHTAAEWVALMGEDVPCAAVGRIEDLFDQPQVTSERLLENFHHSQLGAYRSLSRPIHFSASAVPNPIAAPALGEHTDEILAECGLSAAEIVKLRASGAVA
jgi:crotonobetainyl-CoA:carnitine CoA-transferase CaiB-like acyl-CoA transferase